MIFTKIGEADMQRIIDEHNRLSYGLGLLVGITSKNDVERKESLVDEYETIVTSIVINIVFNECLVTRKT